MENKYVDMISSDSEKVYQKALKMKQLYGYIYVTLKSGTPVYVGQSAVLSYNHTTRYHGSGRLIKKSIRKYGKDKFFTILIDLAETKEELDKLEILHIRRYNTLLPKYGGIGYNISSGGNGCGTYRKGQSNPASSTNMSRKKRVEKGRKGAETRKRLMEEGKLKPRKFSELERSKLSSIAKKRWDEWRKNGKYEEVIAKNPFVKNKDLCKKSQPIATQRAKEIAIVLGSPSAKRYILIDPFGKQYTLEGTIEKFCIENKLSLPRLRRYLNKGVIPEPRPQRRTQLCINTTGWSISGGEFVRTDCKRNK